MATHLHICNPRDGWEWLMKGVALFRKKPGEMFLFGNTYLFILLFVGVLIPVLGPALVTLLTPAFGYGIMLAGKMALNGQRVTPILLFSGLSESNKAHRKNLILLGAVYTACFAIIKLLAFALLGNQPQLDFSDMQNVDPKAMAEFTNYMVSYMAFAAVTSIPVILLFWYAPVLVVWHNMRPVQALFSSWVAVWRNKSAFVIYGMGWGLLSLGFCSVVIGILSLLGLPSGLMGAVNIMVLALVMSASLCTFYYSYTAVFEHDPGIEPLNVSID